MHGCIFLSGGGYASSQCLELEERLSAKHSTFVTEHRADSLRMHGICGAGSQSPVRVLKHMSYPEHPKSKLPLVA